MKCKNCGINESIKCSKYSKGEFCSVKCTKSFSTKNDFQNYKKISCIECNRLVIVNKRGNSTNLYTCKYCLDDKYKGKPSRHYCKWCGQGKTKCKESRPDICEKYRSFTGLIKYFGFDASKIGTTGIYEEYERVKLLLHTEIWDHNKTVLQLCTEYNHQNHGNLTKLIKSLGIRCRTLSESSTNFILKNGLRPVLGKYRYKHGWHKAWDGSSHYYRSSYELDYYKILDSKRIKYETETLRISYWDSILLRYRVAVPDIFIPAKNLIIEIKSKWTYDEQNIKDRVKSFCNRGYKFSLILEGREVTVD